MQSGLSRWVRRVASSPITISVLLAAIVLFIIVHNLGSQPAGLSPAESAARSNSRNLTNLINRPINAPHNFLAYGLHLTGLAWKTALRLSSAIFAVLFLWGFYQLVKGWFGRSIGAMGTVILGSTPVFLIMARQGSAEVMFFSIPIVIALYTWMLRTEKKDIALILLLAAASIFLYTPGMIWWLASGLIISRKKLADSLSVASPPAVAVSVMLALLVLVPLGIGIGKDWILIKQLALIPGHFSAPLETLKHFVWMSSAYFVKAPYHNNFILGRLAALSIIQDALLIFGAYAMWSAAKVKLILMVAIAGFALVVAGLNDNFSLLALGIPALAVIMCAGLRYLYIEWRGVFPRNPLARTLAYSLMWVIVIVQLLFGIRYAVVAWPAAADTKNTYVLK